MNFTGVTSKTGLLDTTARLCRDTRGSLAVWTSIMALPLALSVGVAMDIQRAGRDHSVLKATLDAAVLAAVNNNAIDDRERQAFAEKAFRDGHTGAPIVRLESSIDSGAVTLSATLRTDLTLSSMVGMTELEVSARSTASLNTPDVICALALNETEAGAVTFGDVVDFDARTCSVQSNSDHPDAIVSLGAEGPIASNFCAHGGTTGIFQPGGTGECARVSDPYKTLKLPRPGTCRKAVSRGLKDLSGFLGETAAPAAQAEPGIMDIDIGVGAASSGAAAGMGETSFNEAALIDEFPDISEPVENVAVFPTSPSDRLDEAEAVLRNLMGDESQHIESIEWHDGDDGHIHIKFSDASVNPLGSDKKHLIQANEVDAFIAEFGDSSAPAEMRTDFEASFPVARVTLGDGRTVVLDDDDSHTLVDTGTTLTPGTYCGGLTIAGADVRLMPGTYHMMDGPFVVKDTASVVGDGVTVILGGNQAHLKVESEGRLSLKAPRQGSLKGLVVVEDTSRPSLNADDEIERLTSRITSGGELIVTGTVYLPTHAVEVTGDDSGLGSHAPSTSFIADTLLFDGTGQVRISVDHQAAGLPPVQPRSEDGARLIE